MTDNLQATQGSNRIDDRWYVPQWLDEALQLPSFYVIDTKSAQGRLDIRPKKVAMGDLILFHGHACDGLIRGAYAMRALGDVAFGDAPFDRSDLVVVSKNSPCLGDIAAYLTGGRVRFGSHRLDNSLGVGFVVQVISTGVTWEVREEEGFFPANVVKWEAALVDDELINSGVLDEKSKSELISVNETAQWNWVRSALLPTMPSEHYLVRKVEQVTMPGPIYEARRTDVVNRSAKPSTEFVSPYETNFDVVSGGRSTASPWEQRYLMGPPLSN